MTDETVTTLIATPAPVRRGVPSVLVALLCLFSALAVAGAVGSAVVAHEDVVAGSKALCATANDNRSAVVDLLNRLTGPRTLGQGASQ